MSMRFHRPVCLLVGLLLTAFTQASPPIAFHPSPPAIDGVKAIQLVSTHLEKMKEKKKLYLSELKLVEGSLVPAPKGSSRHWVAILQEEGGDRKQLLKLYVSMSGQVSDEPPSAEK